MKKSIWIIPIVIVVVILLWWLASPYFIDQVVDEDLPVNPGTGGEIQAQAIYEGSFSDADSFHKVSGSARVHDDEGKLYLRFEDFQSTNGPDLKVYLSEDLDASSYVSLGELKGNIGNQFYEIPAGTDLERYDQVLIWCEAFSVLFGSAEITQITS